MIGMSKTIRTNSYNRILLRFMSFITGGALILAPFLLLLSFSYGVGEPPSTDPKSIGYFALPLLVGVALGGGLLLVGLPNLVVGPRRPVLRNAAAILQLISVVAIFCIGFSGSATAIIFPLVLLINATAFFYFVYPAKSFSRNFDIDGSL